MVDWVWDRAGSRNVLDFVSKLGEYSTKYYIPYG